MCAKQCEGSTKSGKRCRKPVAAGRRFCNLHAKSQDTNIQAPPAVPSKFDKKRAETVALLWERDLRLEQTMVAVNRLLAIACQLEVHEAPLLPKMVSKLFSVTSKGGVGQAPYQAREPRVRLEKLKDALTGYPDDHTEEIVINHALYVANEMKREIETNRYKGFDDEIQSLIKICSGFESALVKVQRNCVSE